MQGYAKEMPAEEEFFDDEYGQDADVEDVFHQTVQDIFDEEEVRVMRFHVLSFVSQNSSPMHAQDLLNMHMSVIQENAELLTEEGRLLQQIQVREQQSFYRSSFVISCYFEQGENNDIDAYAARLDQILTRKQVRLYLSCFGQLTIVNTYKLLLSFLTASDQPAQGEARPLPPVAAARGEVQPQTRQHGPAQRILTT